MTLRGMIVGGALALAGPWACVPTGLADDGCDELDDTPCVAWPGTEAPSCEEPQAERLDAWREHVLVLQALGCEGWILEAEEVRRPLDLVERDV
jgi:hypothetical protein